MKFCLPSGGAFSEPREVDPLPRRDRGSAVADELDSSSELHRGFAFAAVVLVGSAQELAWESEFESFLLASILTRSQCLTRRETNLEPRCSIVQEATDDPVSRMR